MDIRDREPAVAPQAAAGLLLAARTLGADLGLDMPRAGAIVDATGASRSRAYEVRDEVLALLPSLIRSPGRPATAADSAPPELSHELRLEVLRFVMSHPGCAYTRGQRRRYTDEFRRFVLELHERHFELPLPAFAEAIEIPLGTLEDWLRPGRIEPSADEPGTPTSDATVPKVEALLDAWRRWSGSAVAPFGEHVREHLRLDFSNAMIGKLLFEHGARTPKRRRGRSPDEEALRDAFETFFAGAQWVGDGTAIEVLVDGEVHRLNLEMMVDAHTGALVGIGVTETEDSEAVVAAFEHGTDTTGAPPLAVLLDNKPCNHTEDIDAALGDTLRIRATPNRAQNKAHVEGAFGLFSQRVPELAVDTTEPNELAKQIALLVALTYARAMNHRPRRDRGGRSRVELYGEPVTEGQRDEARARLQARFRKQERARQSRAARLDPAVRETVDRVFEALGLDDPERHFHDAIALHPLDAIVDAAAIFAGKRIAGTLPDGADARYLLGIVNNLVHVHEADAITQALLEERLAARDRLLEPLRIRRDEIAEAHREPSAHARALVDEAMQVRRLIEREFWLLALAQLLEPLDEDDALELFRGVARRIHATFRVPRHERAAAERRLARRLWPLN